MLSTLLCVCLLNASVFYACRFLPSSLSYLSSTLSSKQFKVVSDLVAEEKICRDAGYMIRSSWIGRKGELKSGSNLEEETTYKRTLRFGKHSWVHYNLVQIICCMCIVMYPYVGCSSSLLTWGHSDCMKLQASRIGRGQLDILEVESN